MVLQGTFMVLFCSRLERGFCMEFCGGCGLKMVAGNGVEMVWRSWKKDGAEWVFKSGKGRNLCFLHLVGLRNIEEILCFLHLVSLRKFCAF